MHQGSSGLEVGGGLAVEHLPTGLSLSAQGRYLVTHHAEAFEEWGAGLTLRVDRGQAGRGLALTLAPMWGEAVSGGVQALWLDQQQLARQTGAVGRPPGGTDAATGGELRRRFAFRTRSFRSHQATSYQRLPPLG